MQNSHKNILFIVNMDERNKTGLFNATHQRIKSLAPYLNEYGVYCIKYYDGTFMSVVKRVFNKRIKKKQEEYFVYEGIRYENKYIKNTVFRKIFSKFGVEFPLFMNLIISNRKKIKKFNLISAHWCYPQGGIAYYFNKIYKIPYTVTLHGSDIHTLPINSIIIQKKTLKILNNSSNNFFVSSGLRDSAYDIGYHKNNYLVLPNGVDISNFYPIDPNKNKKLKEKLDLSGRVVGFVGNLVEVKRADRLPYIFNELKKLYHEEISFLVIGDGKLSAEIKKISEQFQLNIYFTGKVNPEEVKKYMNLMDIMLLPSRNEGWGNVILEAHACGIEVIGSNQGGIPEAIGNPNYIVSDGNKFEEKFVKKVIEVMNENQDVDHLIERVKSQFSADMVASKELNKYNQILVKHNT
ncbi:hypothetical protein CN923_29135 [Bacillus cereus]|uniref:glycosyltransferase n=1 Tax=Bacillus nitratireducens TaxID=2026193 RepID=UPI000BEBE89E|nr:hypothetical protein CON44_08625 [Bacillus cereus]PEX97965.1 hypothetical protein CN465_01450 [Bacillus cereus]PFK10516.1 hypothetical protein COJ05_28965 [Bacillus cereus]PFP59894.1 hypothetical protein COK09_12005 [Bacillus cereus]PFV23745.1 hypothetical protein COK97_08230 [Bacillus cereus]